MRKVVTVLLLMSLSTICTAQNLKIAHIGQFNTTIAPQPRTTIYISLLIEKESIVSGPYARYAMKYLGVTAPLTDKISYTITDCRINDEESYTPLEAREMQIESHISSVDGFTDVTADRLSNEQLSVEQRAVETANSIFALRKSRMDLITGEAGENVFGQGLDAALKEIDRMEQEYLSMFLGKRTRTTEIKNFTVIPEQDKTTYIICRFDTQIGLLGDTDLSGTPVLLDITASSISTKGININTKPSYKDRWYCIANNASCSISYKGEQIGHRTLPIYQFGITVAVSEK